MSRRSESDLGVVHLVRRANGEAPFLRFLDSYRAHAAGVPHELVLLMKGFGSGADAGHFRKLADDVSSHWLSVSDAGYDVTAYLSAARELPHERLCFLNSFTSILADGWLEWLTNALDRPDVGLVGATGSWGSHLSQLQFKLGLRGFYAQLYEGRDQTQQRLPEIAASVPSSHRNVMHSLGIARAIVRRYAGFETFPAHHVRTTGFLVAREVLRRIDSGRQREKFDAYRLESGRRSLTRQVEAMGLGVAVVDRNGHVYDQSEWPDSNTFWQGRQENLMIADNQTITYETADLELRKILSQWAWGHAANPEVLEPSGS